MLFRSEQTSKEVQEDKYLRSLEFDKVLEILSECANTPLGKAKCLELRPFSNKTTIEKELNFVTEAKRLCDDAGNSGAIPVNFIADAKNILTAQRLGAQDIWDLAKTLQTSRITKTFLQKNEGAKLLREEFLGKLISEKALEDEVFGIFNSDLTVKDTASSELKRLKNALNDTQDNLKILISGLLSNSDFVSHLQDTVYTKRDDRTVFQVKASDKSKVTGIVHDVSASNQTFFIEPEVLIPLHNRIRQIESEIRAEIERILFALSQKFHTIKPEILLTVEVLTALDCICARCKYSIQISGVSAELSDTKQVEIQADRKSVV